MRICLLIVVLVSTAGAQFVQQGGKLVGSGGASVALSTFCGPVAYSQGEFQGISVSLSSDGNTALFGGSGDNSGTGATWVFTRSGGAWSQQGPRFGAFDTSLSPIRLGTSVALSNDGNTAIVGGPNFSADGSAFTGATWDSPLIQVVAAGIMMTGFRRCHELARDLDHPGVAPCLLRGELLAVRSYTTADGPAGNHINCIVPDSRGVLWSCTPEGL